MAKEWTLYHNPDCSKSRAAMAYLDEHGIDTDVVEYLGATPTADDIRGLLTKLGVGVRDIIRDGEDEYDEAGLGDKAVIGRPTEAIDDLR